MEARRHRWVSVTGRLHHRTRAPLFFTRTTEARDDRFFAEETTASHTQPQFFCLAGLPEPSFGI